MIGAWVMLAYGRDVVLATLNRVFMDAFKDFEVALVEEIYSFVYALAQGGDALLPILEILLLQFFKPGLVGIDDSA